jgi:hypothetical protein
MGGVNNCLREQMFTYSTILTCSTMRSGLGTPCTLTTESAPPTVKRTFFTLGLTGGRIVPHGSPRRPTEVRCVEGIVVGCNDRSCVTCSTDLATVPLCQCLQNAEGQVRSALPRSNVYHPRGCLRRESPFHQLQPER